MLRLRRFKTPSIVGREVFSEIDILFIFGDNRFYTPEFIELPIIQLLEPLLEILKRIIGDIRDEERADAGKDRKHDTEDRKSYRGVTGTALLRAFHC